MTENHKSKILYLGLDSGQLRHRLEKRYGAPTVEQMGKPFSFKVRSQEARIFSKKGKILVEVPDLMTVPEVVPF